MTLSVELPEDLRTKLEARAAEEGHATIEQYVQALVRADTEGFDYGAPPDLTVNSMEELESFLLKRIVDDAPGIEATPEFWRKLRERARSANGKDAI
jgi:hypothetical protein